MPEETKVTAQTSEDTASQDGVAGAVETNEENASDSSFTDTENENGAGAADEDTDKPEKSDKPAQTKEQNSENARRRREAERQKELKELRERTIIETLGGKNPYTGGEVKDSADVEEFLAMQEIANNGGDPVADFPKYQKQKARDTAKKAESDAKSKEWFQSDGEAFAKAYPDVKLEELIADPEFQDYADGKVGRKPLADIYAGYRKLKGEKKSADKAAEQKARAAAAQRVANKNSAVGALSSANGTEDGMYFTEEQVDAMSVAECEKEWDKVQKSMSHWKKK